METFQMATFVYLKVPNRLESKTVIPPEHLYQFGLLFAHTYPIKQTG